MPYGYVTAMVHSFLSPTVGSMGNAIQPENSAYKEDKEHEVPKLQLLQQIVAPFQKQNRVLYFLTYNMN